MALVTFPWVVLERLAHGSVAGVTVLGRAAYGRIPQRVKGALRRFAMAFGHP